MGIKQLNTFLKQTCNNQIKKLTFNDIANKKLAIDVSIYLYKYLQEKALIENFYLMIKLFRKYNIIPVFVFVGKPPKEKYEIIDKRKKEKSIARETYESLDKKIKCLEKKPSLRNQGLIFALKKQMQEEYKKSVKITIRDVRRVKNLMNALGVCYLEADGEADVLCAQLVKTKMVYGCLSEDMDMFAYGCNKIYRDINIYSQTIVYYDYVKILKTLKLSSKEFREICVFTGTDYNEKNNIFNVFKLFKLFKKSKETEFYEWLMKNKYVDDSIALYKTYFMFDNLEPIKKPNMELKPIDISNLKNILQKNDFIFPLM
jgi:5'-3' exonuclease